jgi:ABC-type ATPase involved in cell division
MISRLINPLKNKSFFLFGPRGSGKSTWLEIYFMNKKSNSGALYLDLLSVHLTDELL